jgi:NitT/TauT family transport system substrate-binding protein
VTGYALPEVSVPIASRARRLAAAAAVAILVVACGGGGTSPTASPTSPASTPAASPGAPSTGASPAASPIALTVGLGYIPNVQFAQFYLADQSGAYAKAGLDVTLQNKIDPDLVTLLGQGGLDIGLSDGTSIIPAVSQGIPVVYTSTVYGQFPSIVVAPKASGITKAADLKGKRIGIPGRYGSSWIMLQALLKSANLTPDDVTIVEFPDFSQVAGLQQGRVDAATGFANNEPIQLKNAGIEPVVLTVDDIVPLPGPGLVTGTATLQAKHDALAAFTAVTLQAMTDIAADPQKGLDATFKAVPDLAADPALQRQVLDATVAAWKNPRTNAPLGAIDRQGWQESLDFMTSLGLVPNKVTVDQLVDESLLP